MNSEFLLLYFLFVHWIADFVSQTSWMAENKWKDNDALFTHTLVYTLVWGIALLFINLSPLVLVFCVITFLAHTITDGITSQFTHKCSVRKDYHNMFVIIGFDQILHYVQIYLTYKLLFIN